MERLDLLDLSFIFDPTHDQTLSMARERALPIAQLCVFTQRNLAPWDTLRLLRLLDRVDALRQSSSGVAQSAVTIDRGCKGR